MSRSSAEESCQRQTPVSEIAETRCHDRLVGFAEPKPGLVQILVRCGFLRACISANWYRPFIFRQQWDRSLAEGPLVKQEF